MRKMDAHKRILGGGFCVICFPQSQGGEQWTLVKPLTTKFSDSVTAVSLSKIK
jgi:hypothetical protein